MLRRGNGPGLNGVTVLTIASTCAFGWLGAAEHDFSSGWLTFACLLSALGVIGLVRGLLRL